MPIFSGNHFGSQGCNCHPQKMGCNYSCRNGCDCECQINRAKENSLSFWLRHQADIEYRLWLATKLENQEKVT